MGRIGDLDRRIVLQSRSVARGTAGSEVVSWSTSATVWAQVMEARTSERFLADSVRENKGTVFRIRYRTGVTPQMRVSYDSKFYNITGVRELHRRKYLDLDTEYLEATQDGI